MYVLFDLDSTLVKIEGLDEIAKWKGLGDQVSKITEDTMSGNVDFTSAFPSKVELVAPSLDDLKQLGKLYIKTAIEGLEELIAKLKSKEITVGIITGNIDPAPAIFAKHFGIDPGMVFANKIEFNKDKSFKAINSKQTLCRETGKSEIIAKIKEETCDEVVFVGDSTGDLVTESVADKFVGFGGVIVREKVIQLAKEFANNINELENIVLK